MRAAQVGVATVVLGLTIGIVKYTIRSERRQAREQAAAAQEAADEPSRRHQQALAERMFRAEAERIEHGRPSFGAECAAYSGPVPEYGEEPASQGGDNAKIMRELVDGLREAESRLTRDQVRRLRVTLYVFQERYRTVAFTAPEVDEAFEAQLHAFLSDDEFKEVRRALAAGTYSVLPAIRPLRVAG